MKIALVDNGSLEPAPHKGLRRAAAALSDLTGVEVEAVSWKHSNRIAPGALDGLPARTLAPWMRAELALGRREFVFLLFFISPQGAIGSSLRADVEALGAPVEGFAATFAGGLADAGALPEIVADRVLETIVAGRIPGRPAVIVVDHGGPSTASARLRDEVAAAVRERLGGRAGSLSAASMESPGDGAAFAFNRPLLAEVLDRPQFEAGDVVIAPLFLAPGRHAGPEGDLALIARAAQKRHPRLRCHFTALVGGHPLVVETLAQSLRTALAVPAFS